MEHYISFFIASFTTTFVLVDPPGNIPSFLALTERFGAEFREAVSKKSVLLGCSILIVFALAGKLFLEFFNISINSLRIAGGILLFVIAIDILLGSRRDTYTSSDATETDADSLAIFPIAIPLYTGPGAITGTIVLANEATDLIMRGVVILSIVAVYGIARLTHMYSHLVIRYLGSSGSNIIARLMAIFLAAIAVEFVFTGLEEKMAGIG